MSAETMEEGMGMGMGEGEGAEGDAPREYRCCTSRLQSPLALAASGCVKTMSTSLLSGLPRR